MISITQDFLELFNSAIYKENEEIFLQYYEKNYILLALEYLSDKSKSFMFDKSPQNTILSIKNTIKEPEFDKVYSFKDGKRQNPITAIEDFLKKKVEAFNKKKNDFDEFVEALKKNERYKNLVESIADSKIYFDNEEPNRKLYYYKSFTLDGFEVNLLNNELYLSEKAKALELLLKEEFCSKLASDFKKNHTVIPKKESKFSKESALKLLAFKNENKTISADKILKKWDAEYGAKYGGRTKAQDFLKELYGTQSDLLKLTKSDIDKHF